MTQTQSTKDFYSRRDILRVSNNPDTYEFRIRTYINLLEKNRLLKPSYRVLDIGCGNGEILVRLPYKNKTGIDIVKNKKFFQNNPTSKLYMHNLDSGLPSEILKRKYDIIFLLDILEHISFVDKLFSDIKKISHKDTHLLISLLNDGHLVNRAKFFFTGTIIAEMCPYDQPHLRYFNKSQIIYREF